MGGQREAGIRRQDLRLEFAGQHVVDEFAAAGVDCFDLDRMAVDLGLARLEAGEGFGHPGLLAGAAGDRHQLPVGGWRWAGSRGVAAGLGGAATGRVIRRWLIAAADQAEKQGEGGEQREAEGKLHAAQPAATS